MATLLLAETDPRTIDLLPRILSDSVPDVVEIRAILRESLTDHEGGAAVTY